MILGIGAAWPLVPFLAFVKPKLTWKWSPVVILGSTWVSLRKPRLITRCSLENHPPNPPPHRHTHTHKICHVDSTTTQKKTVLLASSNTNTWLQHLRLVEMLSSLILIHPSVHVFFHWKLCKITIFIKVFSSYDSECAMEQFTAMVGRKVCFSKFDSSQHENCGLLHGVQDTGSSLRQRSSSILVSCSEGCKWMAWSKAAVSPLRKDSVEVRHLIKILGVSLLWFSMQVHKGQEITKSLWRDCISLLTRRWIGID